MAVSVSMVFITMKQKNTKPSLWAKREQEGLCVYCGKESVKDLSTKGCKACLQKKVKGQVDYSRTHSDRIKTYGKRVRKAVVDKYGGKCCCCGETELLFLTMDHKNNDGGKERLALSGRKGGKSSSFYMKLRREPVRDDIQVLCFNCNLGRAANGGVCPHHKPSLPTYEHELDLRRNRGNDIGTKIAWPDNDTLISRVNETGLMNVAKELGVHDTAIRGRLKRRGLYELVNKRTHKK